MASEAVREERITNGILFTREMLSRGAGVYAAEGVCAPLPGFSDFLGNCDSRDDTGRARLAIAELPGAYTTAADRFVFGGVGAGAHADSFSFGAFDAGAKTVVAESPEIPAIETVGPDARWPSEEALARAWDAREYLTGTLRTETGAEVQVVYPGQRNTGDGPDFLDALIVTGEPGQRGRLTRGDIELHLRASDWYAHGHDGNPAFASVILHVVATAGGMMRIAGAPILEIYPRPAKRRNRRGAATGLASEYGESGRAAVRRAGAGDPGGRSNRERRLEILLESLGDARLEERAAALEGDIALVGAEQALHEALFRGLGYTRNMTPFQEAARLLPIASIREMTAGAPSGSARHARISGLLFGTAGLLPSQRGAGRQFSLQGMGGGDLQNGETWDDFTAIVESEWARFSGLESLPRGAWRTFRVRPDNHPVRRTALAVELVERWLEGPGAADALRKAVRTAASPREAITALLDALMMPAAGYWAVHRDFGVARRGGPGALLGRGRALDIIVTAVLPFLFAVADLEGDSLLENRALAVHAALPSPDESGPVRYARAQLAREYGDMAGSLRLSARSQQGLFHLASQYAGGAQSPRESLNGSVPF